MLIYDTTCLTFNDAIINTATAKLFLYTHETGALVMMATLKQPNGKVFFTTDEIHLDFFCKDRISLQYLFDATAANMVTVVEDNECKLYMRLDADIQLCEGEKRLSQFERKNNDTALPTGMPASK